MSGAIIDLVAQGVQDVYLTGNPEVSFFQQSYRRHTNFAMSPVRLDPNGSGTQINIKIPNKGDLLSYIWIDLGSDTVGGTEIAADTTAPASFELWIGGQMIDRQDAFYMVQLWQKFLLDSSAKGFATIPTSDDTATTLTTFITAKWLPLHFFFCDSYGLPLVALQYNEVEIRINYAGGDPSGYKYYANYVVLDTDERAMFVNKDHEILIEQIQRVTVNQNITATFQDVSFDLNLLNHPVKCLLWGNPSSIGSSNLTTSNVQIYLNGTEMFGSVMPDPFFTQVQPYYHSEFASELLKGDSGAPGTGGKLKMYSFAVKANRHYPTGSCNFSRLDNAKLTMSFSADAVFNPFYVHAVNFNILRIKKGMAGLAFAN
jgi:hypothetical protein